jgi:hypothetical protein
MIPGSSRNWIAVNAVQQSTLNKKIKAIGDLAVISVVLWSGRNFW